MALFTQSDLKLLNAIADEVVRAAPSEPSLAAVKLSANLTNKKLQKVSRCLLFGKRFYPSSWIARVADKFLADAQARLNQPETDPWEEILLAQETSSTSLTSSTTRTL